MHFHDRRLKNQYFYKLASRNVRKCAKDYFIYFFTLMLSVALFYSFNSVSTQFASLGLEDTLNYLAFSSGVLVGSCWSYRLHGSSLHLPQWGSFFSSTQHRYILHRSSPVYSSQNGFPSIFGHPPHSFW